MRELKQKPMTLIIAKNNTIYTDTTITKGFYKTNCQEVKVFRCTYTKSLVASAGFVSTTQRMFKYIDGNELSDMHHIGDKLRELNLERKEDDDQNSLIILNSDGINLIGPDGALYKMNDFACIGSGRFIAESILTYNKTALIDDIYAIANQMIPSISKEFKTFKL